MTTPLNGERGSAAVEMAVIAPALVVLLLVVVFAGRVSQTEAEVRRAAGEGARAASLEQQPIAAELAARTAVEANLAAKGVSCAELRTIVDTILMAPGGEVSVNVRCVTDMSDLALIGVPGQRAFEARSTEVIDRYRGGTP